MLSLHLKTSKLPCENQVICDKAACRSLYETPIASGSLTSFARTNAGQHFCAMKSDTSRIRRARSDASSGRAIRSIVATAFRAAAAVAKPMAAFAAPIESSRPPSLRQSGLSARRGLTGAKRTAGRPGDLRAASSSDLGIKIAGYCPHGGKSRGIDEQLKPKIMAECPKQEPSEQRSDASNGEHFQRMPAADIDGAKKAPTGYRSKGNRTQEQVNKRHNVE
jgi:hypothetical protein